MCVCVWWAYYLWHIHLHMCVCWSCHTRHSHKHPSSPPHHCTHITHMHPYVHTHMHTHTQTHILYRNCIKVKWEAKIRVCLSEHNISSTRNALELETVTKLQHYMHTKNHFPELCTLIKQAFQQSLQSSGRPRIGMKAYRLIQCIRLYDGRPTLYL